MIFFFKKKPIVLHCVTYRSDVIEWAPIQRTSKFIPEWWKNLPHTAHRQGDLFEHGTMKWCSGFTDLYTRGITIPMWCDLSLEIGEIGTDSYRYHYADRESSLQSHAPSQHGNYFDTNIYQHLKLNSPWFFMCKENIKFVVMEPTWSIIRYKTLRVLPGVVNFKHQSGTNINMFVVRTTKVQNIMIPFLEPIMNLVPCSDRPVKIVLSDDPKLVVKGKTMNYLSTFANKYQTNISARKKLK